MPSGNSTAATTTTGEDSTSIKGIKAGGNLVINEGKFTIDSADDSIHSNTSLEINGGVFEMASGDDAFHADENLTVNAGTIHITKSYEGLERLHVRIAGGEITLVASDDGLNAAGGTEVITVQVGSQAAGTALTLLDSEGNTVLTGTPDLPYEFTYWKEGERPSSFRSIPSP